MKKRKRTEKSKYKHDSTGDYCTCAAYVAEVMCRKNAENRNEGALPYKFWSKKPWDWTFKRQLIIANKLVKDFSELAVAKAVNSPEFNRIFSLNHPKAKDIIKKYHIIVLQDEAKPKEEIKHVENAEHRKTSYGKKKNILQKLRNIENGEEEGDGEKGDKE
jgi:hypothetical protein